MSEAAEIVAVDDELLPAVREAAPPATLFGTDNPAAVIERATAAAKPLAEVVRKQRLASSIQGREHVKVEGWTLLGSMLGVFPVTVWTRPVMRGDAIHGYEARVEARTRDGAVVGAAEAQCCRDENQWSHSPRGRNGQQLTPRDDYALRSMAQTRATSKALRQPLGFVMQLAGFDATPAEEMPTVETPTVASYDPNETTRRPAPEVQVHFGKNAGTALKDLSPRQLEWYATKWTPDPARESEQDRVLKQAAVALHSGEPVAAGGGDLDGIPFMWSAI